MDDFHRNQADFRNDARFDPGTAPEHGEGNPRKETALFMGIGCLAGMGILALAGMLLSGLRDSTAWKAIRNTWPGKEPAPVAEEIPQTLVEASVTPEERMEEPPAPVPPTLAASAEEAAPSDDGPAGDVAETDDEEETPEEATEETTAADAAAWREAAEAGDAEAQWQLGYCLAEGRGTPRNETEARKWFKEAAYQGHGQARSVLGAQWNRNSPDDELLTLHEAASNGDASAQRRLGKHYLFGIHAFSEWLEIRQWHQAGLARVPEGYEARQAVRWLEAGAKGGDAEALYWLAFCAAEGIGMPKNEPLACRMLATSAKRGFPNAKDERSRLMEGENMLRARSRRGDRVAQFKLGKMLAERGDAEGLKLLRRVADTPSGRMAALWLEARCADRDRQQAAYWCHRAADLGDAGAMRRMVDYEPEQALKWWTKVHENGGGDEAARAIARCYEEGRGCARNLDEARKWYQRAHAPFDVHRMEEAGKKIRTYAR